MPTSAWRAFFDALFQRPIGIPSNQPLVFSDDPPVLSPPPSVARKAPSVSRTRTNVSEVDFKAAIRLASLVVANDPSRSLPILNCAYLTEGRLIATCLDQYLIVDLPGLHIMRPVCVPLRMLKELLPQLSGMPSFTLDGDTLTINQRWRLPTMDAAEFPLCVPLQQVMRNAIQLVDDVFPVPADLDALFPAVSTDETRIQLCGVCFDRPRGALVASNGHVLYHLTGLAAGARQFTVPMEALKIVRTLQRQATTVQAGYYAPVIPPTQKPDEPSNEKDFVCFSVPDIQLWTRLIVIDFPDYLQVMPRENAIMARLTLPRAPLIDALSGALPLLPKNERPDSSRNGVLLYSVRPGEGVLHYESTETGIYTVTFPAPGWPVGFHVGLNVRYLLSALKAVPENPETIEVAFTSDVSPTRWANRAFTAIVMPMRVFDRFPEELQTIIDAQRAHEEDEDLARMEADERSLS